VDKVDRPLRQLNGGCIEGYCPGEQPDRPTLVAHSHEPAKQESSRSFIIVAVARVGHQF